MGSCHQGLPGARGFQGRSPRLAQGTAAGMDSRSFRSRLITCWRCGICLGVTAIPLIGCWGAGVPGGLGLLTGRPHPGGLRRGGALGGLSGLLGRRSSVAVSLWLTPPPTPCPPVRQQIRLILMRRNRKGSVPTWMVPPSVAAAWFCSSRWPRSAGGANPTSHHAARGSEARPSNTLPEPRQPPRRCDRLCPPPRSLPPTAPR